MQWTAVNYLSVSLVFSCYFLLGPSKSPYKEAGPYGGFLRQTPSSHPLLQLLSEVFVCVCTKALQSCLTLGDPTDCSPAGSSFYGILQARILEWVAMPSSRGIFLTQGSNPCILSPALAGVFFTISTIQEALKYLDNI